VPLIGDKNSPTAAPRNAYWRAATRFTTKKSASCSGTNAGSVAATLTTVIAVLNAAITARRESSSVRAGSPARSTRRSPSRLTIITNRPRMPARNDTVIGTMIAPWRLRMPTVTGASTSPTVAVTA
jgi:hypothetical protein